MLKQEQQPIKALRLATFKNNHPTSLAIRMAVKYFLKVLRLKSYLVKLRPNKVVIIEVNIDLSN